MQSFFPTRQDAIDRAIVPALVRSASAPADFNLDLIFDRCFTADPVRCGWVLSADVDEFAEAVELAAK